MPVGKDSGLWPGVRPRMGTFTKSANGRTMWPQGLSAAIAYRIAMKKKKKPLRNSNPPKIHLECSHYRKRETNSTVYQSVFYEILSKYPDFMRIYTDGSKTDQGVGSAIAIEDEVRRWTLPHACSIFSAELYAIWQALRYCDMSHCNSFLICSTL